MCSTGYGQPALAATWWVTRGAKLRVVGGGEAAVGGALSDSSGGCSVAAGTLPLCGDRAYATELSDTGWRMYVGGCVLPIIHVPQIGRQLWSTGRAILKY